MKPISPEEATAKKIASIPDHVIEAWNRIIAEKFKAGSATVMEKEIVERLTTYGNREVIYANGWLDIEPLFRREGWDVAYDKPGYNETYEASFKFTAKRRG